MRNLFIAALFLTGSTACEGGFGNGGQFGEESGAHCEVVNTTALALDEASVLGFSGQAVLDAAQGSHPDTLTWADGTTTELTLDVVYSAGEVRYVEEQMVDDSDDGGIEPAIAMDCPTRVEVDVSIALATADGALDESWDVALRAQSEDGAEFRQALDAPAGTFDVWDHVPAGSDYDEADASLSITFGAYTEGAIDGQGEGVIGDPDDEDSAVYAENFSIATWGGDPEPDI